VFKTKGIGLGLTTAKTLTNMMQGGIHLNSNFGCGTEVGFSVMVKKTASKINSKQLKTKMREIKNSLYCVGLNS
jgi:K+-sensing histidine kinase KdpD